jgi:hypothetical protein
MELLKKLSKPQKQAFRVSQSYRKILRAAKRRIQYRLRVRSWPAQPDPMLSAKNIHYELSQKSGAISAGGIGVVHQLARKTGLIQAIDSSLHLLKFHVPYHESDHVLNFAYNTLAGGQRLEDMELRRQDENFLNALGASRIPDPTTAGDFTRRFDPATILVLQEAINKARQNVWKRQPASFLDRAFIDIDGTIAGTLGERKQGMDISYKGIWGYHPLIVTLANTKEVLYLANRPGNAPSHEGAAGWIDRAIALVKPHAGSICLRGDTDFSLTGELDRWSREADFIFGMDASQALVQRAEALAEELWQPLDRSKPESENPRDKRPNYKEEIVERREFVNQRLLGEEAAEFDYKPGKCGQSYRVVAVRKNISVEKGGDWLFDEIRYFFYITTRRDLTVFEVVAQANQRCDQENVIAQLKGAVNAMRMPMDNLESNWAYMVMTALAWNLKAWYALLAGSGEAARNLLKMEFRTFTQAVIWLPAQIIRTGRKIIYRLQSWSPWTREVMNMWERLRQMGV